MPIPSAPEAHADATEKHGSIAIVNGNQAGSTVGHQHWDNKWTYPRGLSWNDNIGRFFETMQPSIADETITLIFR
jgi:hypothetical protein